MSKTGVISGINGPIVHVKGDPGFTMNEMVYVGPVSYTHLAVCTAQER